MNDKELHDMLEDSGVLAQGARVKKTDVEAGGGRLPGGDCALALATSSGKIRLKKRGF